jgi:hypothetical protein
MANPSHANAPRRTIPTTASAGCVGRGRGCGAHAVGDELEPVAQRELSEPFDLVGGEGALPDQDQAEWPVAEHGELGLGMILAELAEAGQRGLAGPGDLNVCAVVPSDARTPAPASFCWAIAWSASVWIRAAEVFGSSSDLSSVVSPAATSLFATCSQAASDAVARSAAVPMNVRARLSIDGFDEHASHLRSH